MIGQVFDGNCLPADLYLFEGKLWIDVDDYSVVRIEGHPAKKLCFWIQRADFVWQ